MNALRLTPVRLQTLLVALLTALLVVGTASLPASAATGDVTGATLQWGVKQSFRNYISGPIAHGHWTVSGNVTDATSFSWTGGGGAANQAGATGSVGYAGSIHFQGHEDFGGIGAGNYALDLTISDVHVVQLSATAAQLVVDTYSNSLAAPTVFTTNNDVVFADVNLTGTATSTATTVSFANAPAVLTADGAAAFAGFYSAGTALDPVSFAWPVEQPPAPPVPTVSVSTSSEISPAGEIVTVTGTGFSPVAPSTNGTRPPLAGQFGGVYVAFGKFATVWKPSAAAPSSARKTGAVTWVVNAANLATVDPTASGTAVAINADGSFSLQLLVKRGFTGEPATGNYGIYTYPGSGATYAPFETYTPVSFSTAPLVTVSKTTGLNPLGDTLTITGYNFTPSAPSTNGTRPPLAGKFGGVYVAYGKFANVWKPSAAAPSASRKTGAVTWIVDAADLATVDPTSNGSAAAINADGTFTLTLTASRDFAGEPATGNYGIYTYPGSGAVHAPFETYTPLAFTAATGTTTTLTASPSTGLIEGGATTLSAQVSPVAAGTVSFSTNGTLLGSSAVDGAGLATLRITDLAAGVQSYTAAFTPSAPLLFAGSTGSLSLTVANKVVGAGSLSWGIKSSFRSYVTGTIAKGSITATGVGVSGGVFTFGQTAGASFDQWTGLGSSPYSGSVRFYGHGGLLDVTLANPSVVVTNATAATLYLSVNGAASIPFASLNLSAGTRSTPNNTVSYGGVPATLTSQGAAVFEFNGNGFYPAGEPFDPVSFTIGSANAVGGGAKTVAAFVGNEPTATPPATTGITLPEGVDPADLEEGGEYTFEASGFGSGETGVLFVHYSDPVVLADDLKANAAGVVSWTGPLPAGLTGEHTFTFQGSVDRGIVVTINPVIETAALEGCAVTGGDLTWGFKESFRSYISGSIANGEWTVANGASYETPNFGWTNATGTYDPATGEGLVSFTGSITFTGHGGILNTTVADPQLRFDDAETAYLILDVTGTTQEGEEVDKQDVEFVRLDLSAAEIDTAADGTVTITGAPASLTAAGSQAFGTYESGEEFDPVTVSFATGADCAEAVILPVDDDNAIDSEPASSNLSWVIWAIVALLVLAAIAAVVVVRRRSAQRGSAQGA